MATKIIEIGKNNATFQGFQALKNNRQRRHKEGRFLIEGVKPLNLLLESGWAIDSLLVKNGASSAWCKDYAKKAEPETVYKLSPELMSEISGKDESSELMAVAVSPSLDPSALKAGPGVWVVADRPNSPGNLGSLIRSAEAFGARGVLSYGHSADFFDPKCIAASIGAVFAIPLAHLGSPGDFAALRVRLQPLQVAALDENGDVEASEIRRQGATVIVVGNETDGLSKVFKDSCDVKVKIKMSGKASSLNAAAAGSILLYELLARDSHA